MPNHFPNIYPRRPLGSHPDKHCCIQLDLAAAEPDVAEPDTVEPDIAELDVVEPDVVELDVVEPDAAEPDAVELDFAEPLARCLMLAKWKVDMTR